MAECPFDSKFVFTKTCNKIDCPYHHGKSSKFFNYDNPTTNCVLIDVPEAYTCLYDSSPWTSADKKGLLNKETSIRAIRRSLEVLPKVFHVALSVITEVPINDFCSVCGYPTKDCFDSKECEERLKWVNKVCTKLNIDSNKFARANIWNLLIKDSLELNDAVILRNGLRLIKRNE